LLEQPGLDPLVSLLTLPVRPMTEIPGATDQILRPRPDLIDTVLTILGERFPQLTRKEIMTKENKRLAELESRMDALLLNADSSSQTPPATGSN